MQSLRLVSWRKVVVSVLVVFPILFGQAPALICQGIASISGQVTTRDGAIIPFGVTVRLETNEGQLVAQQPADSSGHYEFDNIYKIDYHLVVSATGFQTAEREANLRHSGDNVTANFRLTPKNKTQENKGAVTSVAELKIPERARKEYRKGQRAFRAHHFSEAQRHFEQATQDYPCYARAQTDMATTLIVRKAHLSEAENRLRKAIRCDSSFLNAYEELAQLLNAEKQYTESAKILKQGLAHSPDSWQFHYEMGIAHFGMKDYGEAEKEFREVSSLNKTPPPILHVKLADVYLKESKYDDAYREMKAYLRAKPKGPFAPRIRTVMKQMEAAGVLSSQAASR
ncbi:MAG: carboxypeptidase regulatory-like domain-containing protein [Acidobacteriota bacterium]